MISKILFIYHLLLTHQIQHTYDYVDDRALYRVDSKSLRVKYAYQEEILNWLETGVFVYNEDL
jgi:hypothetical protein